MISALYFIPHIFIAYYKDDYKDKKVNYNIADINKKMFNKTQIDTRIILFLLLTECRIKII